jgi:hypothetical protein
MVYSSVKQIYTDDKHKTYLFINRLHRDQILLQIICGQSKIKKILSNLPNTSASSGINITVSSTYRHNNTAKIDQILCVFSQEDNWIPYVIFYHCIFGF